MNNITKILRALSFLSGINLSVGAMEFDTNPNIKITYLPGNAPVRLMEFDSLDRLKAFHSDGTVKLWNVDTENCEDIIFDQDNWATAVDFSPDGQFIASGHANGSIDLYNVKTKSHVNTFWGHKNLVSAVAFSSDGRFIASGSWDNTVKLWDLENKKSIDVLFDKLGHNDRVNTVAFSPNGRIIASGSDDGTVILWNIYNKKFNYCFIHKDKSGGPVAVTAVAFNKNGTRIAVGLSEGMVEVYTDFFALVRIEALAHAQNSSLDVELPTQALDAYILQLIYENLYLKPWETVFGL
jgi:WD40 repeat protein